jgi:hypothetical protein
MLMQSQLQLCEFEDFPMLIVHEEGDIQTRRRWITMYANREAMEFDGSVWISWCVASLPSFATILGEEPLQLPTFISNAKETLRLFDFFPITSSR